MRTTGQGGLVYYFITVERDRAYLLPMRIAGFAKMVGIVEEKTESIRRMFVLWLNLGCILFYWSLHLFYCLLMLGRFPVPVVLLGNAIAQRLVFNETVKTDSTNI